MVLQKTKDGKQLKTVDVALSHITSQTHSQRFLSLQVFDFSTLCPQFGTSKDWDASFLGTPGNRVITVASGNYRSVG